MRLYDEIQKQTASLFITMRFASVVKRVHRQAINTDLSNLQETSRRPKMPASTHVNRSLCSPKRQGLLPGARLSPCGNSCCLHAVGTGLRTEQHHHPPADHQKLIEIKGLSEAKVDKLVEAARGACPWFGIMSARDLEGQV